MDSLVYGVRILSAFDGVLHGWFPIFHFSLLQHQLGAFAALTALYLFSAL